MKDKYNEIVTSDTIPDRLGPWEPASKKAKEDELYKKRIKRNPSLKNNIKKIGETMKTTVTFSSNEQSAISRQWHLCFMHADKSWNQLDPSNISVNNGTYSFTIENYGKDQRFDDDSWLNSILVAGVSFTKTVRESEEEKEAKIFESVLDNSINLDIDVEKIADLLLADDIEAKEAEEDDSKDGESDTIDDVQSMLTKMLPKTKNLKLGADKEKELKATLSKAMKMMEGKEVEDSIKEMSASEIDTILKTHNMQLGAQIATMTDDFDNFMKLDGFKDIKNSARAEVKKGYMAAKKKGAKVVTPKSFRKAAGNSSRQTASVEEAMDYPQFNFAIMMPRDDYQFAAKILNDSNIKAKTQFHQGEMAVVGFDLHQETGDGKPNVTEDEVLEILNNAGIAAISAAGMEFNEEPMSIEIEESIELKEAVYSSGEVSYSELKTGAKELVEFSKQALDHLKKIKAEKGASGYFLTSENAKTKFEKDLVNKRGLAASLFFQYLMNLKGLSVARKKDGILIEKVKANDKKAARFSLDNGYKKDELIGVQIGYPEFWKDIKIKAPKIEMPGGEGTFKF